MPSAPDRESGFELVILAAGMGERLLPLTRDVPKSLLDLGDGRCLLERQISSAKACGAIKHVTVVVGYLARMVEARVNNVDFGIGVSTIFNPVYRTTNNLLSLWFALPVLRCNDFVVSNGDNLYKAVALPAVASCGDGIWLTTDRKPEYDDDDMKVLLTDDGMVRQVSKQIGAAVANAESVGLVAVRGDRYRHAFCRELEELVREEARLNHFWLEVINGLAAKGHLVRSIEIPSDAWVELDFHPDIKRLRSNILAKLDWLE